MSLAPVDAADDAYARQDRSRSRGRDFKSSGRGGAGNIHAAAVVDEGSYVDSVPVRGREATDAPARPIVSTGRGGAGNFRSPSRGPTSPQVQQQRAHDEELIRVHAADTTVVHSSGRGGAGNIVGRADGSRSRSRGPAVHMTGRGGAGNIVAGDHPYTDQKDLEDLEEEERALKARGRNGVVHSTGRGGLANITALPTPPADTPPTHTPGAYESTGRGGAGNILSALRLGRSRSRDVSTGRDGSVPRASTDSAATAPRTVPAVQVDGIAPPPAALNRGRERVPAYATPTSPTSPDGADADAAARSRSREGPQGAAHPPGFWERVRHPLSPRSSSAYAREETIVE